MCSSDLHATLVRVCARGLAHVRTEDAASSIQTSEPMTVTPHIVAPENAQRITEWLETRGGLAVWHSVDLSDLGFSMTTPVRGIDGKTVTKPHWKLDDKPARIITDAKDVLVSKDIEVKRFRVGIRLGSQGMKLKVSDGGSRRIRSAVAKAGSGSFYVFDYSTQEAVIMRPESQIPLLEFLRRS